MSNYFDKQAYAGRIGGKITFAGVLFPNFRTIFPPSSHRESTYKKYAREYINHILPHIGNKPIEECTEDEFISVLQKIESIRSYKATKELRGACGSSERNSLVRSMGLEKSSENRLFCLIL